MQTSVEMETEQEKENNNDCKSCHARESCLLCAPQMAAGLSPLILRAATAWLWVGAQGIEGSLLLCLALRCSLAPFMLVFLPALGGL